MSRNIVALVLIVALVVSGAAPNAYALELDLASGINQIITTATTSVPGGAAFPNVFGSEGKDLYGKIYEKVRSAGTEIAIEKTAGARNLTKGEIMAILPGAFITDVMQNEKPAEGLDLTQIQARLRDTQQQLLEEKHLADLQVGLMLEVTPTELFANGDEDDSGFDLLTDLMIMEILLFGKTESNFGGLSTGNENRQSGASASAPAQQQPQQNASQPPASPPAPQAPPVSASTPPSAASETPASSGGASSGAASAGVVCPINTSFNDAVARARDVEKNPSGVNGGAVPPPTNASQPPTGGGGGGSSGATGEPKPPSAQAKVFVEEFAKNPGVEFPCNEVFCLKLDLLYKKATVYKKRDNCVACHVEYINEILTKAMNKGLLPSKASGNLFEVPLCKGGNNWSPFSSASFNVVTIANPIVTPPNDDILTKGSFVENAKIFWELYWGSPGRCQDGKCKEDPKPQEEAAARALESATETTNQAEILQAVRNEVAERRLQQKKVFEQFQNDAAAKPQSAQYQDLLQQMDTMNSYFQSFQNLFRDIVNADEPSSPCRILRDKPICG